MSTNSSILKVGELDVLVVRKSIKNIHLSILPPDGKIRVSSPLRVRDDVVRTLIATRIPWITKQQAKFQAQERQSPRQFLSGESHYYLGARYLLDVVEKSGPSRVYVQGNKKIILELRPGAPIKKREELLMQWYRREFKTITENLLDKWQQQIGVQARQYGIKQMKTRWGTCNHREKTIWLNLELVKKPLASIEYVVVHELLHLIEKKHNDRFAALMTQFFPAWQTTKAELNRGILSHEEWEN